MSVFQGDFLGFTLGEIHSSQLNITRVSSGDRYTDILLPSFKDVTAEAPGGDGMYYWNTFYTQKPFTLDFAYDDLRDEDLRALRKLFSFKGVQPLIFDELPYKKYMVKCVAPPTFKYICFDYMEMRLYKGEGSINLMAYYPYALATSPITFYNKRNKNIFIDNPGDLDADFNVCYSFIENAEAGEGTKGVSRAEDLTLIRLKDLNDNKLKEMKFSGIKRQGDDVLLSINTQTHLIEGLDENNNKTGHLYNKYITSGDWFKMPPGRYKFYGSNYCKMLKCTPLYY